MADDYHIIGGMVAFIIVVLAVIGSASTEYPEIAGAATAPQGGQWPPSFPIFGELTPELQPAPGCDVITLCLNVFAWWLIATFTFFLDIVLFLVQIVVFITQLFVGLAAFALHGLPIELAWLGLAVSILFIIIFALIFIRLVISAIPFAGG